MKYSIVTTTSLELAIFWLEIRLLIHLTKQPVMPRTLIKAISKANQIQRENQLFNVDDK